MQTRNKYAMMVDAMINDIFGFLNDVCKMESIFVFSVLVFLCLCGAPFSKRQGTFFIGVFRSKLCRWSEDRRQWSHEGQTGGPHAATVPGRVGHPFWPSSLRLFASFAPRSSSFQILILLYLQVIWTSFGSLKHQNIENRVFCLRRVNSRKIGELVNYSQNHYKTLI